ncbi:MAG TPA: T9SS type A sorting domain-containing protein [Hymenobacter sp.]|uniref:T9SS type A sorting domain-containing protein n=1 Tax=Hymenobacter sp. TaxID=1898978 RepID=UPI002D80D8B5|nr:T9SS type A sorting domain-containing protein [Hymenobacter sp.]HET9506149.1 T9SS type A sorting domain-containing protein [Hymenobacter sp.]
MRLFTIALFLLGFLQGHATPQGRYYGQARQPLAVARHPEQSIAPTLSVFPNPSQGQLTVQLTGQLGQDYKLRLTNILGREVLLLGLHPEQPAGLSVSLAGLPSGLYFYSLLVNDKVVSTKRLTLQNS